MKRHVGQYLLWLPLILSGSSGYWAVGGEAAVSQKPEVAEQDIWRRWQLAHEGARAMAAPEAEGRVPAQADKASGILGLEVRSPKHERLGWVQDLVCDWRSGRVEYVVMRTEPPDVHGGVKLLAVPMTRFRRIQGQSYVVLNSTKASVAAAKGFDPTDWPAIGGSSRSARSALPDR